MPDPNLLIKYHEGNATEAESRQVEVWLNEKAAHQEQYNQFIRIWLHSEQAGVFEQIDTEADWAQLASQLGESRNVIPFKKKPMISGFYRIAAAVVVLMCVAIGLFWILNREVPEPQLIVVTHAKSAQPLETILPDGSVVFLNAQSTLTYPESFTGKKREVQVEGEAYFDVTPNPDQPFVITTERIITEVLGTSFNISAYPDQNSFLLTVNEGTVAVSEVDNPDKKVTVTQNEIAKYNKETRELTEEVNADPNYLSWKTGILTFDNTPLDLVLATLRRHYNASLSVHLSMLPASLTCPVTASYQDETLDSVLEELSVIIDLEYRQSREGIMITGVKCSDP